MDDEPPLVHGEQGERSAQIINVELGKGLAVISICSALCGIAMAVALWAGYQAQVMTTEYRVQLNHTMHLEAEQDSLKNRVDLLEKDNAVQ